jgi:galactosyl transferase GMA12/MNN10 family
MIENAGGRFSCHTEIEFWSRFETEVKSNDFWNLQNDLFSLKTNMTQIFDCNVGVIAAYDHLARLSPYRKAYRLLQMAMVFIFTLRTGVRIPEEQGKLWNISKDDIVQRIRQYKRVIDREDFVRRKNQWVQVPLDFKDPRRVKDQRKIGVVTICAYPDDHPLILKDTSPLNKQQYTSRHGYELFVFKSHPLPGTDTCIQHSKLHAMREILISHPEIEWLIWMDCDSTVVNMGKTLDSIIHQFTQYDRTDERRGILDGEYRGLGDERIQILHGLNEERFLVVSSLLGKTRFSKGKINMKENTVEIEYNSLVNLTVLTSGVVTVVGAAFGAAVNIRFMKSGLTWIKQGKRKHLNWKQRNFPSRFLEPLFTQQPNKFKRPSKCSGSLCNLIPTDPNVNLLITEEGWGMSSADWLIKNTPWSIDFLENAFHLANTSIPLFGDQDAIITMATNEFALDSDLTKFEYLDPHVRVIPQRTINSYDSLNAHHMQCHGYQPGDLIVTFPACKQPEYCNALFWCASLGPDQCPPGQIRERVFGPERVSVKQDN